MTLDLIPWEQKPSAELEPAVIKWNEGFFHVPRQGYMTIDELTRIREVDPENEIYRATLDTTVRLHKALEADDYYDIPTKHQLFLMISTIHFEHKGVRNLGFEIDPLKEELETTYKETIDNYIETIKELEMRIMRRSATVMMQRTKPEWTDDQTISLPEGIILQLYSLQQQEEHAGRNEDPAEQRRAIEEDLKKLQAALSSIVAARTGLTPTGNVDDYGRTPLNSDAAASVDSQPPMSQQPLKEATKTKGKGFIEKN